MVRDLSHFCSYHAQLSRSRCAENARTICIHRFQPGYVSVETLSVVRNICQSSKFTPWLLNLQSPTERNAHILARFLLHTRSGYLGSNGRTQNEVGSLHFSSGDFTNPRQRRLNTALSSLMAGCRWPGWRPTSTTITITYYRPRTSIIKPHFPQ